MTNEQIKLSGGTAFPTAGYTLGMTLRDYFAAQALIGLLAFSPSDCGPDGQLSADVAAMEAYEFADAMLSARDDSMNLAASVAASVGEKTNAGGGA